MEDKYPKAYKQVIEILKYVPQESVDKIPKEMIKTFKINMDDKYDFKIDISKSFEEQDIFEETKAILANIFRDYWATPEQKERILEKEKNDREIEENIKRETRRYAKRQLTWFRREEDAVWLFADDFDAPADLISAAEDIARAHFED